MYYKSACLVEASFTGMPNHLLDSHQVLTLPFLITALKTSILIWEQEKCQWISLSDHNPGMYFYQLHKLVNDRWIRLNREHLWHLSDSPELGIRVERDTTTGEIALLESKVSSGLYLCMGGVQPAPSTQNPIGYKLKEQIAPALLQVGDRVIALLPSYPLFQHPALQE